MRFARILLLIVSGVAALGTLLPELAGAVQGRASRPKPAARPSVKPPKDPCNGPKNQAEIVECRRALSRRFEVGSQLFGARAFAARATGKQAEADRYDAQLAQLEADYKSRLEKLQVIEQSLKARNRPATSPGSAAPRSGAGASAGSSRPASE